MKYNYFAKTTDTPGQADKTLADHHSVILDFIASAMDHKYFVIKTRGGEEEADMVPVEDMQLTFVDLRMCAGNEVTPLTLIETNFGDSIPVILLTTKNTPLQTLPPGAAPTIAYANPDLLFIEKLQAIIRHHIDNEALNADYIANLMHMSKPTLYRKIKSASGISINELINTTRLKAAAKLLENSQYKIYEVSNMVGYSSQSQLARNFFKQFGITPREYQQSQRKRNKFNRLYPSREERQAM